jgi:AraC family transcriptional regulator of adaptative response / DNA-3-methyladenine glycosylase II
MILTQYSDLTPEQCQKARMARDPRFDGCFFVAVKTTRIFCRPICPAKLPKEQHVEYFSSPQTALGAGYRPCLRCRPESAPNSWAWRGIETTFARAIKMIEKGALQSETLAQLSLRLDISDSYLRKLFHSHLGMSPKQYAQYYQLMFSKQLLHSSTMSIAEVAFASGFNSVRRFNDAFQKYLYLTPSQIRKRPQNTRAKNIIFLAVNGPVNWHEMLAYYRPRAINILEKVDHSCYQRYFELNATQGWFKTHCEDSQLRIEFEMDDIRQLRGLVINLRRMFDLDADIQCIEQHLSDLQPGFVRSRGIRIPGTWDLWEAGIRAILGQQVSIKAAIAQLNRLVETLSRRDAAKFPLPEQVANADLDFLGMPQSRKQTLKRFARFFLQQPHADPIKWLDIKGIGPWTVDYARMRGHSHSDCFLANDLGVKKTFEKFGSLDRESISPWGSYATFHCWDNQL